MSMIFLKSFFLRILKFCNKYFIQRISVLKKDTKM